jgi:hypothetical protein
MSKAAVIQLRLDVAVFDAMCAARPLSPPPLRVTTPTRTAGALALESDRRAGLLGGLMYVGPSGLHRSL